MKKSIYVHLILGIGQIVTGILGSCFAFVVSGILMLFKGISTASENAKKPIKTIVCVVFALLCVFLTYYSFFMFVSELDYAAVRPEVWIVLPLAVTLVALVYMLLSAYDDLYCDGKNNISAAKTGMDSAIEDLTTFAIIFVGWLGTFVFDFYFDYAAAACIVVCLVKHIKDYLSPTNTTTKITTSVSEELPSDPETHS